MGIALSGMLLLDLTLPAPPENIALDEALLLWCEKGPGRPLLRFWESLSPLVVLGRSNRVREETDLDACARDSVPVIRRCSGGGTVLLGPGCLNYSLVLPVGEEGYHSIGFTNRRVLASLCRALAPAVPGAMNQGVTDLAVDGRKFSGNAQCRKNRYFLFHGTFLLHANLSLMEKYLRFPSRSPEYRRGRKHTDFVMNLEKPAEEIKRLLAEFWQASESAADYPQSLVRELVEAKYGCDDWNMKY